MIALYSMLKKAALFCEKEHIASENTPQLVDETSIVENTIQSSSLFDAPEMPLSGIRVLDFGQYMAGPLAASLLQDAGATVIRIEPPGGPKWKSPAMKGLTKGKRIIHLDLKQRDDLLEAKKMVRDADVVIENFRPGVMQRLGLGSDVCCRANPKLVYLSLPGFASTDKQRAGIQAWEGVILASAGVLHAMGPNRVLMGKMPSYTPVPLASAFAGVIGASSVTAALHSREVTGRGDAIEVPLACALLECLVHNTINVDQMPERYIDPRERIIEQHIHDDKPVQMTYEEVKNVLDPFYCHYWCADGLPFYLVSCNHRAHMERALKVLGLWEELTLAGLPLGQPGDSFRRGRDRMNGAGAEWVLGMSPVLGPWESILREKMVAAFQKKTAAQWERLMADAGVPVAAHRTSLDWLRSSHVREAGLAIEVNDATYGKMLLPGPCAWVSEAKTDDHKSFAEIEAPAGEATSQYRPRHSRRRPSETSVACDIFDNRSKIPENPGWLHGLKVLDFCNVIAGPTVAMIMERFGAEVIKVDAADSSFDPHTLVLYGLSHHRGKRSTLVDMKKAAGRKIVHDLIKAWKPDVITINAPQRQLAPLGLDEKTIRMFAKDVVILRLDAWGGPIAGGGERSDDVGYDDVVQAAQGMQERFGGGFDTVEEHAHVGTIDVVTGWAGAFATLQALIHARRLQRFPKSDITPKLNARTSLAAVGHYVQLPFMYDCKDRELHPVEPRGADALGESSLVRCYQVADGWIFVHATDKVKLECALSDVDVDDDVMSPVTKCAGAPNFRKQSWLKYEDTDALDYGVVFRQRETAFWLEELQKLGVAAAPFVPMSAVRQCGSLVSGGQAVGDDTFLFESHPDHPAGRLVEIFAPCAIRPALAPIVAPKPAVKYGSDTVSVLFEEVGYTLEHIEELLETNVISESLGDEYLPSD